MDEKTALSPEKAVFVIIKDIHDVNIPFITIRFRK